MHRLADNTGNSWQVMQLQLYCGTARNPEPVVAALAGDGISISVTIDTSWPEHLELRAAGSLDFPVLDHAVAILSETLCPQETTIPVRIVRADDEFDLLYHIPCDDRAEAISTLANDIRAYDGQKDPFRTWFRSRWMGHEEEDQFTAEELAAEPLTADRMLAYLDPPKFRDWRPIQSFIE